MMASPNPSHTPPHLSSSCEPSLVRKDSMEDPELTPSRKRPRLDSGSPTMSTDRAFSPSRHHARNDDVPSSIQEPEHLPQNSPTSDITNTHLSSPKGTPSQVTVAIRSPHKENTTHDPFKSSPPSPSLRTMTEHIKLDGSEVEAHNPVQQGIDPGLTTNGSPSEQALPVEIIADKSGDAANSRTDSMLDSVEDAASQLRKTFPFAGPPEGAVGAAYMLAEHCQNGSQLDYGAIQALVVWLKRHVQRSGHNRTDWVDLYSTTWDIWEVLAALLHNLLTRRLSLHAQWPAPHLNTLFADLFRHFAVVFSHLLWVDSQNISSLPIEGSKPPIFLSGPYLLVFNLAFRPRKDGLPISLSWLYHDKCHFDPGVALIWTSLSARKIVPQMAEAFLDPQVKGAQHLTELVSTLLKQIYQVAVLRDPLRHCLCIAQHLLSIPLIIQYDEDEDGTANENSWTSLAPSVLSIFEEISTELYTSVETSTSSSTLDAEIVRDLIRHVEYLPPLLAHIDAHFGQVLFNKLIADTEAPQDFDTNLLQGVWVIRLLKRFICKGRMDMRITGVEQMHHELVSVYQRYQANATHNTLVYLARVLIDEKILDVIIGPDSHPQLISRSGNILAFLAVTQTYSAAHTDTIWETLSNHQDHRVVTAISVMLRSMLSHMSLPNLLHICEKLQEFSLDRFGHEAKMFIEIMMFSLLDKLGTKPRDPAESLIPNSLSLRLLRDALNPLTRLPWDLANLGLDMFTHTYARLTRPEERLSILQNCIEDISGGTMTANGSIVALIKAMAGPYSEESVSYLTDQLNAPVVIVKHTCQIIDSQNHASSDQMFTYKLRNHFELLHKLILERPDAFPMELDRAIWDHVVGPSAITSIGRNMGWDCFRLTIEKADNPNSFVERGLAKQLPHIPSESFTPSSFRFLEAAVQYQSRFHPEVCTPLSDAVHVPLEDQLWKCVLTVPPNSIENETMNLLVSLYLEPEHTRDTATRPILELTHVTLVQKCVKQLTDACTMLKSSACVGEIEGSSMNVDRSHGEILAAELRFSRTLRLLIVMLQRVRANKDLSPTPARSSPKLKKQDASEATKEPITLKYQAFDGNDHSDIALMIVSGQDSLAELSRNLSDLTGFAYYKLICGGQHIDLEKDCGMTVGESGIASRGLLIVIKKADSQISQTSSTAAMGGSAFERELLKSFNDLYDLMDSDDDYSFAILDFLRLFKPQGKALDIITSDTTTTADIFPSGKTSRMQYLLQCLRLHLNEQVQQDMVHQSFLLRSIRLLDSAFLQGVLVGQSIRTPQEWKLAVDGVDCFCDFLRTLPIDVEHDALFSDPPALVDRLFLVLWNTQTEGQLSASDHGELIIRTFHLMLQAAAYSPAIWSSFCGRDDFAVLHKTLLLSHEILHVREKVASMILSALEMHYPTTHLTRSTAAAAYMPILKTLISEGTQNKDRAQQFFDIALAVFRANYESGLLMRDTLCSFFSDWSGLLLSLCGQPKQQTNTGANSEIINIDDQCIGRGTVNEGLLGLTRLLKLCASILNRRTFSLESRTLVREICSSLLYPCTADLDDLTEQGDEPFAVTQIPVLDTPTRKELHELVLLLSSDSEALQVVVKTTLEALEQGTTIDKGSWQIDRSKHIRTPTGYVGISNLSNTCYMNSLLSQLFMNVGFRRFILSANVASPTDQPLLAETQKLFANMQDSYAKYAKSADFASVIPGLDGNPIDVSVQMDVDEFFAQLFDLWESQLLSDKDRDDFRKFYRGSYVTQIRPSDCAHVSEKIENFNALQLEVRGKSTLQESLKAYVEGDVMSGENKYQCTQCDGGRYSNYAVKRTCLKEIPDSLILHLKRFDYDLVTLSRLKVNDQFEFPERIDMSPYKLDRLTNPEAQNEEDIFELVGILVHSGTAETGHYYSFIRERPAPSGKQPRWLQFNDISVTDFNPGLIGMNCFGGLSSEGNEGEKHFSAYMLFYERTSKLSADTNMVDDSAQPRTPIKVPVPVPIESEIMSANKRHLIRYCLFDPDFPQFIQKLLEKVRISTGDTHTADLELQSMTMQLLFQTLDRVVARTKEYPQLDAMINFLVGFSLQDESFAWRAIVFLADNIDIALNLMIRGSRHRYTIQKQFENILLDLRENDRELYGMASFPNSLDSSAFMINYAGALPKFVKGLEGQLSSLPPHDRTWEDYFKLVLGLAGLGSFETGLILRYGFLEDCLGILMCDLDEELASKFKSAVCLTQRTDGKLPPFKTLMKLFQHLLNVININVGFVADNERQMAAYNIKNKRFPLTRTAWDLLTLFESQEGLPFLKRIFEWNAWSSELDTSNVSADIVSILTKQMPPTAPLLQHVFNTLKALDLMTSSNVCEQNVLAIVAFCRECPKVEMAEELINLVANRCRHLEGHMGRPYLQFFEEIYGVRNARIDAAVDRITVQNLISSSANVAMDLVVENAKPEKNNASNEEEDASNEGDDTSNLPWQGTFYSLIVRTAPHWGHYLLICETEPGVREQTAELLNTVLFSRDPSSMSAGDPTMERPKRSDSIQEISATRANVEDEKESAKIKHMHHIRTCAIRTLFYTGLQTCSEAQRSQMNKAFYVPMLNTMDRCAQWLRNLLAAEGDEAEDLRKIGRIWARERWYGDDDLLSWWRRLMRLARDEWIEEEIVEVSDGEDFEEEDSDLALEEP